MNVQKVSGKPGRGPGTIAPKPFADAANTVPPRQALPGTGHPWTDPGIVQPGSVQPPQGQIDLMNNAADQARQAQLLAQGNGPAPSSGPNAYEDTPTYSNPR